MQSQTKTKELGFNAVEMTGVGVGRGDGGGVSGRRKHGHSSFFFFFVFFPFLGPLLWHMGVPRLGGESER